jgi:hypothetical protein
MAATPGRRPLISKGAGALFRRLAQDDGGRKMARSAASLVSPSTTGGRNFAGAGTSTVATGRTGIGATGNARLSGMDRADDGATPRPVARPAKSPRAGLFARPRSARCRRGTCCRREPAGAQQRAAGAAAGRKSSGRQVRGLRGRDRRHDGSPGEGRPARGHRSADAQRLQARTFTGCQAAGRG